MLLTSRFRILFDLIVTTSFVIFTCITRYAFLISSTALFIHYDMHIRYVVTYFHPQKDVCAIKPSNEQMKVFNSVSLTHSHLHVRIYMILMILYIIYIITKPKHKHRHTAYGVRRMVPTPPTACTWLFAFVVRASESSHLLVEMRNFRECRMKDPLQIKTFFRFMWIWNFDLNSQQHLLNFLGECNCFFN